MNLTNLKIGLADGFPVRWRDRHTHALVIGKSGTGKSNLLLNWWKEDNYYPTAKVLIEPSGFLADEAYSISKGLYCSIEHPLSINPMTAPYNENTISDSIAEALNQVIELTTPNQPLTAKMRSLLDEAVKYCLRNDRKTLVNVLDNLKKQQGNIETRDGIIQRLQMLTNDERMHPILCGKGFNWGEFIQSGQSFVLNAFGMSADKMIFVGNTISQGLKNCFRYERPKEYKPLALYVDESHLFMNKNVMDILKEGRKFKLSAIMSVVDFATIPVNMTRLLLNVGSIVSFRVGHAEARLVAQEMNVAITELQDLEKYHCAFMTPKEKGIAKTPRPPLTRPVVFEKKPAVKAKGWFLIQPYQSTG